MSELDLDALRRLEPWQIAAEFHRAYEALAPSFGYATRRETAVTWDQVPEQNKALMIAATRAVVIEWLGLPRLLDALGRVPELEAANQRLQQSLALHERADKERAELLEAALGGLDEDVRSALDLLTGWNSRGVSGISAVPSSIKILNEALERAAALAAAPGDTQPGALQVIRQLAYRGKEGCTSPLCTRLSLTDSAGSCYGWHCARCDEPCSSQGHDCTAAPGEEGGEKPHGEHPGELEMGWHA